MTTPPHKPARPSSTPQNADIPDSESTDQAPDAWRPLDDWERWLAEGSVEMAEFGGADHTDLAIDDDGRHVRLRGRLLSGGRETAAGSREWQDAGARYYRMTDGQRQHLLIIAGASTLLIEDWRQGDLGIRLRNLRRHKASRAETHRIRALQVAARARGQRRPRQPPPRNRRQPPADGDAEPEADRRARHPAHPTRGLFRIRHWLRPWRDLRHWHPALAIYKLPPCEGKCKTGD